MRTPDNAGRAARWAGLLLLTAAAAQAAPRPPRIQAPENGAIIPWTGAANLSWHSSPDADGSGRVFYAIRAMDLDDPGARLSGNNCAGDPHYLCLNLHHFNGINGEYTTNLGPRGMAVTRGHCYGWWVHAVGRDGSFSEPAYATFCVDDPGGRPGTPDALAPHGATAPAGTTSVRLTWRRAPNSPTYAVRVVDLLDPAVRHPGIAAGAPHYYVRDGVPANEARVQVQPGRCYLWWVHGVNSGGRYGEAAGARFCVNP